jgi:uncharacterized protein (DUF1330 family)
MKKGYWIVSADVSDLEKFTNYAAKTPAVVEKFGGRFLVRAGEFMLAEGSARSRNTLIEFPSYQLAIDCWESKEYKNAKALRVGGAELDIVIVEGCAD